MASIYNQIGYWRGTILRIRSDQKEENGIDFKRKETTDSSSDCESKYAETVRGFE